MAGEICPYLGIEEDKETAVAFPSPRNRCFRSGGPAAVSDLQQDRYCLQFTYAQCPVYLLKQQTQTAAAKPTAKAEAKPKPKTPAAIKSPARIPEPKPVKPTKPRATVQVAKSLPTRPAPARPVSNSRQAKNTVLTGLMSGGVIAILLAAILILPAYGAQIFSIRQAQPPLMTATFQPEAGVIHIQGSPLAAAATETRAPTATKATSTRQASATITRTPTRTAVKPSKTATRRATRTQTPRQPAVVPPAATAYPNCGVPYGWVQYIVQPGDTLTSISQRTGVSVYQLQTANCMGGSTMLYAGMTLYVPFVPAPPAPTLVPPTKTLKPSPAPPTSTPVPTSTVKPTDIPETPPTVVPTAVIPSATLVPVEPEPTEVTPPVSENGGVN